LGKEESTETTGEAEAGSETPGEISVETKEQPTIEDTSISAEKK